MLQRTALSTVSESQRTEQEQLLADKEAELAELSKAHAQLYSAAGPISFSDDRPQGGNGCELMPNGGAETVSGEHRTAATHPRGRLHVHPLHPATDESTAEAPVVPAGVRHVHPLHPATDETTTEAPIVQAGVRHVHPLHSATDETTTEAPLLPGHVRHVHPLHSATDETTAEAPIVQAGVRHVHPLHSATDETTVEAPIVQAGVRHVHPLQAATDETPAEVPEPPPPLTRVHHERPPHAANNESSADEPLLRFKSDEPFKTQSEVERRSRARFDLRSALASQIDDQASRQAAATAAEVQADKDRLAYQQGSRGFSSTPASAPSPPAAAALAGAPVEEAAARGQARRSATPADESDMGAPVLRFKSDHAFETEAEHAARVATSKELKAQLDAQVPPAAPRCETLQVPEYLVCRDATMRSTTSCATLF
jgi:hypothetical protein